MFKKNAWVIALGGLVLAAQAGAATITVTPWLAPNIYGAPSFPGAEQNAIAGILAGGVTTGSGPEQFMAQTTPVSKSEVVVTGFNSWHGVINPGAAFGAAYAGEYGNRMHFGLYINGDGQQFSISQLGFSATSSDAGNALAFAYPNGYSYGSGYQGILKGTDGMLGTSDDIFIDSGLDTQLVDALVSRGSGNSIEALCTVCDDADKNASIAAAAAGLGPGSVQFTGTYTLTSALAGTIASGSGTFNINDVPEPGSMALAGLGLAALGVSRRRRRLHAA